MTRPSQLFEAYGNFKIATHTLSLSTVTQVAEASPDRCFLCFNWTLSGAGLPGSTTYMYVAPEGYSPTAFGLLLWQSWPKAELHARDWGPFVSMAWYAQTPVAGNKLTVFEYDWDPNKLKG